jgi:hypothetical protein
VTSLDRVNHCRRDPHGQSEFVGIVSGDQGAAYTGLQTCTSLWACPVCSAKVRHERALRIARCALNWASDGGGLVFPTLTLAHRKSDSLADTLGHLLGAWKAVSRSGTYRRVCRRLGVRHSIRAVEITYGYNGWHPHLHLLLFTQSDLSPADLRDYWATVLRIWQAYVERHHLRPIDPSRAVYVKAASLTSRKGLEVLGEYLSKAQDGYGIAAEMVRGDLKRGRSKASRSPFALAESAVAGDREALRLWREYEQTTKGRHVLEVSQGAKAALGWGEDLTDEEVTQQEDGGLVFDLTPHEWSLVVRYRRRGYLLNVADLAGRPAVEAAVASLRRRETYEAAKAARKAARP